MTDRQQEFLDTYTAKLREAILRDPDNYIDTVETAHRTTESIVQSLIAGRPVHFGNALRAAARAYGISSQKDLIEYLQH